MAPIKSIAIIGAGPAGAITVDALSQEQAFDSIRVFERREKAGGCWCVLLLLLLLLLLLVLLLSSSNIFLTGPGIG